MQATASIHEHFQLPSPLPELRQFDAAELSKQLEQCRQPVHHVLVFSPAEWDAKPAEAPSVSPKLDVRAHLTAMQENETLKKQVAGHRAEQDRLANLLIERAGELAGTKSAHEVAFNNYALARNENEVLKKKVQELETTVRNLESQNKLYSDTLRFEALMDKIKANPKRCHELGRQGGMGIFAIPSEDLRDGPEFIVRDQIRDDMGIPLVTNHNVTNRWRVYKREEASTFLLQEVKRVTPPSAAKTQ